MLREGFGERGADPGDVTAGAEQADRADDRVQLAAGGRVDGVEAGEVEDCDPGPLVAQGLQQALTAVLKCVPERCSDSTPLTSTLTMLYC